MFCLTIVACYISVNFLNTSSVCFGPVFFCTHEEYKPLISLSGSESPEEPQRFDALGTCTLHTATALIPKHSFCSPLNPSLAPPPLSSFPSFYLLFLPSFFSHISFPPLPPSPFIYPKALIQAFTLLQSRAHQQGLMRPCACALSCASACALSCTYVARVPVFLSFQRAHCSKGLFYHACRPGRLADQDAAQMAVGRAAQWGTSAVQAAVARRRRRLRL